MYSAILLSGGKGNRMRKDVPKQYLLLAGKPIIMHSLEKLDSIPEITEIVIVCDEKFNDSIKLMCKQYFIESPIVFAKAGSTRQESVYNGLIKASNSKVIIHEAARPFVLTKDYYKLIENENDNVILGETIPFTVIKGDEKVRSLLSRDELINVQLPQKFNRDLLLRSHKKAIENNLVFTEDASLLYYFTKCDITIERGGSYNIKITEPIDLQIGEEIYKEYISRRK